MPLGIKKPKIKKPNLKRALGRAVPVKMGKKMGATMGKEMQRMAKGAETLMGTRGVRKTTQAFKKAQKKVKKVKRYTAGGGY